MNIRTALAITAAFDTDTSLPVDELARHAAHQVLIEAGIAEATEDEETLSRVALLVERMATRYAEDAAELGTTAARAIHWNQHCGASALEVLPGATGSRQRMLAAAHNWEPSLIPDTAETWAETVENWAQALLEELDDRIGKKLAGNPT